MHTNFITSVKNLTEFANLKLIDVKSWQDHEKSQIDTAEA